MLSTSKRIGINMEYKKVALIGNPNTGKSSIFNHLTGLNQQVGNFPGVTVDKKTGQFFLTPEKKVLLVDLPGTYSVFPRSKDEEVVYRTLSEKNGSDFPEQVVVLVDVSNLERNLFLFTQLYDMGLPVIMGLTMTDVALKQHLKTDTEAISKAFGGVPVVQLNGRTGQGIQELKQQMANYKRPSEFKPISERPIHELFLRKEEQAENARERYVFIRELVKNVQGKTKSTLASSFSQQFDRLSVHPFFGYALFAGILMLIFQFVFSIAAYPMDWIDGVFLQFSQTVKNSLPPGVFTDLLAEGVVPGIGGVLVFIPQIAVLFFFLSILEETGYMSRVVFIMDKLVRPFGLNGRSVVPLMSSVACAIPGIMATRTINSWKDRLITIMVAPLMSCSARIPVYTLLIALIVPDDRVWGVFHLKGLVLFALYAMGLFSALLVAAVLKRLVNSRERSFLLMELPAFKFPRWKQVGINLWEKTRVFVVDAGKVILAISIVLWAMASYGPGDRITRAEAAVEAPSVSNSKTAEDYERELSTARLENSYIGIVGKGIEPLIRPLGYDWKIGIALITSFAAREVFVGSMAAIYSAGEDFEEDHSLLERMRAEVNPITGQKVYNLASGASLMVFYVFAMQCMATFAVVKRETKSWKWPLIQLIYMGILAYLGAFITYTLLL